MFNLTVNSTHVANSLNNTYVYNFKSGGFIVPENAQMMITSFTIPYSFYNISQRYNNNVLRIYWPTGIVSVITLTNGGSGYTAVPTVVFTGANSTAATATAILTPTTIASITRTAAGTGYTSAPTVVFTGGGGTGAAATAAFAAGGVTTITVTNPGTGYTSVPTISFTGGGGTGATATAALTGTSIASITIGGGGTGYAADPTISFTGGGGGSNAAATTSLYVPFTVTIPDGFYTVNTLNLFLQKFMVDNRIHSIDNSGNNIFYLSMAPNSVVYGNQVLLKTVPTSLAAGITSPTGTNPSFPGLPTGTGRTPYIEILNNNFSKFLGFSPGNYGLLATTDQSFVSNITPKGSTVNNLVLKCSIVNNNTTNQSDIIDVFSIGAATGGATFGGNLNYANDIEKWVRITPGTYNSIIITIVDENMQDIAILDNNLLINFLIKTP